jgi:hypothetical protein
VRYTNKKRQRKKEEGQMNAEKKEECEIVTERRREKLLSECDREFNK